MFWGLSGWVAGGWLGAQVVITSGDLPEPGDSVQVVQYNPGFLNLSLQTETGAGYFWDYSDLVDSAYRMVYYLDVPTSFVWAYKNPILYPENMASYCMRDSQSRFWQTLDSMGLPIVIGNTWTFYRVDPNRFVITGIGVEMNGFPLAFRYTPIDTVFLLPTAFGSTVSSQAEFGEQIPGIGYYGGRIQRTTWIDGWGTLVTPFDTFDVVRIRTRTVRSDTLHLDSLGIGFRFPPRTEEVYWWYSPAYSTPVLELQGIPVGNSSVQVRQVMYVDTTRRTQDTVNTAIALPHGQTSALTCSEQIQQLRRVLAGKTGSFPMALRHWTFYTVTGKRLTAEQILHGVWNREGMRAGWLPLAVRIEDPACQYATVIVLPQPTQK